MPETFDQFLVQAVHPGSHRSRCAAPAGVAARDQNWMRYMKSGKNPFWYTGLIRSVTGL